MSRRVALEVRRARQSDAAALIKLFRRFYREERFPRAAIARVPRTLAAVLRRNDTPVFVAEAGGRIIGAAAMSTAYGLEVGLYGELEDIYVLPEWRRCGVACSTRPRRRGSSSSMPAPRTT